MSYLSSMPSTLQRRLLRYLLSQLDFLETDDLDLENLGITWGQRSVVQLKDVGVKVKKLPAVLHLPASITFISARISLVKLTVPADILTSGVVIDICGVQVQVRVAQDNPQQQQHSRPEQHKAPAKGTQANRPRITAPSVHDPGGASETKRYRSLDESLLYPHQAVHHLAESFLQTESHEVRSELQAAIGSRSRLERDSPSSSVASEEEAGVGVGTGEGYTLPSFIASYLVGITDRMRLHVNDVAVLVGFGHPDEGQNFTLNEPARPARLLVKISDMGADPVGPAQTATSGHAPKRKFWLDHLDILVLPDPASDSSDPSSSQPRSPTMTQSQANSLSVAPAVDATQRLGTNVKYDKPPHLIADRSSDVTEPVGPESSRSYGRTALYDEPLGPAFAPPSLDSSIDESVISQLSSRRSNPSLTLHPRSPPNLSPFASFTSPPLSADDDGFQDFGDVNHEAHTASAGQSIGGSHASDTSDTKNETYAGVLEQHDRPAEAIGREIDPAQSVEDLTQSRIFTHHEAESMYLSAMGPSKASEMKTNAMPGGWNWSGEEEDVSHPMDRLNEAQSLTHPVPNHSSTTSDPVKTPAVPYDFPLGAEILHSEALVDNDGLLATLPPTAKKLLSVYRVSLWLPTDHTLDHRGRSTPYKATTHAPTWNKVGTQSCANQESPTSSGRDTSASDPEYISRVIRDGGRGENPDHEALTAELLRAVEIEVVNVHCHFDMLLGKTLIAVAKSISTSSGEISGASRESAPSVPMPTVSMNINNVEITLLENVPEQSTSDPGTHRSSHHDELLLSVSLNGLLYQTLCLPQGLQHRMRLREVSLSHSGGQFLSFTPESRVRTSLRDSLGLQQDDVEITVSPNTSTSKIHIHTKPVQLIFELSQMDDILSRSGGLSSLLELGSSIASSSTVRTGIGKGNERRIKPHGVRFAGPSATEMQSENDPGLAVGKVNFRMGGMSLDIVGSESTLKAGTSAIKVVHRTEGVGMQIDRISLEGPFLTQSNEPPQLSANIHNMRVEYLQIPRDHDLDRLLTILTPSKDKYETDDDIMVDTLLRQRRKGGVLRLTVTSLTNSMDGTSHMAHLKKMGSELSKLSTVTKYLPEDDRPGILCLGLVKSLNVDVDLEEPLGTFQLQAQTLEGAYVNVPSLIAAQVGAVMVQHDQAERLLGQAVSYSDATKVPPMIMCRFVADEMDPTVKVKLFNVCAEYRASFVAALQKQMDIPHVEKADDSSDSSSPSIAPPSSPSSGEGAAEFVRKTNISIAIRDSAFGITPRDFNARAVLLLTDAFLLSPLADSQDIKVSTEVRKASVMVAERGTTESPVPDEILVTDAPQQEDLVKGLLRLGFVTVAYVSSAITAFSVAQSTHRCHACVDVELRKALLILESCADSTQTLVKILGGLSPPAAPVEASRYRTEIMPIEDLLASFTGDAFVTEPGPDAGLRASRRADADTTIPQDEDIEYLSGLRHSAYEEEDEDDYRDEHESRLDDEDDVSDSCLQSEILDSEMDESTVSVSVAPVSINESVMEASHHDGLASSLLDFRQDHFGSSPSAGGTKSGLGSRPNVSGVSAGRHMVKPPLRACVRDVHIIWNLYDGYDWQSTRDVISDAVKDIEARAAAQRPKSSSRLPPGAEDEEEEAVIGDFLFNSVYIGIPVNKDPRELANEINRDIDDHTSDMGSHASFTTITGSPARHQGPRHKPKRLKLNRSKRHKITIELQGVAADMTVFPPGSGEVQNSLDFRVKDVEIFDHIPTSTWKKFATYMRDAGEREANTSMIHIEILNVRPVPDLAVSEMVLKVTVLPLRLHVDQDAVDFLSRFFEFKGESPPTTSPPSAPAFLQRVEVNPVKLRLDFKPKRVDYGGLRSGRTTEFMNFFVLDQADMILRRVILYGVSGFDRLGVMLNNIWTPDVKRNQLPGILAGLAPIRSLVNVGSGVKDLVVVPMREYKKDGRIVRSIQKGALAFAKTTSKELVGLGAKLAIGTQTVLQTAETMLVPSSPEERSRPDAGTGGGDNDAHDDDDDGSGVRKQISLYADQPIGVVQGLRSAYASLERDLLLAKDAIIAVPGEAMASGSAKGAAKAVLKQAPTVILRPAIGATKAVGHTLLGAGNTLDRENWRRMEEKYKRH